MSQAFYNGAIYTVDSDRPWATAVLIADGSIVAVGDDDDIRSAAEEGTEFVDLDGAMMMPGLHDAHSHLLIAGLKFKYEQRLTPMTGSTEQVVHDLEDCRCSAPLFQGPTQWIVGGEFVPMAFPEGDLDRAFLDESFPDTPVFLYDWSIHHGLANSKALELAGITDETPDPPGGRYVRRPGTNELTGEVVERAGAPIALAMAPYQDEIRDAALSYAVGRCHEFGVTSVQEASGSPATMGAYLSLDKRDELNLHVATHLIWREESFAHASVDELDELIARRHELQTPHIDPNHIKIWMDGAPLPPHFTHAGLDDNGAAETSKLLHDMDDLVEALCRFDEAGLSVKIHCAGEGAARATLDAYAEVRRRNGTSGTTHEMAHCNFVSESDLSRFKELDVIAEISPAVWHIPEFGMREAGAFRFKSIENAGAHMTIGSDWVITPDPNLFPAIQGMLEWGDESITLDKALHMATIDGARAVGRDHERGSITVGKSADLIVLDRNLFKVPTERIGGVKVLRTVFEGRTVYEPTPN